MYLLPDDVEVLYCTLGTSKRPPRRKGYPKKPGADLASELTSDVPDSPQPAMHNTLRHDYPPIDVYSVTSELRLV
jgi:hypothetical protein